MVRKGKQTPLTLELFEDVILPRLGETFATKDDLGELHNDLLDFKLEVLAEIEKFREEMIILPYQVGRNTKRIERVEDHLKLPPIE